MKILKLLAFFPALLLFSCQTNTNPYKQASEKGYGYKHIKLSDNDYIITFTGSYSLDIDKVESYALRRAAELAIEKGYNAFTVNDLVIDSDKNVNSFGHVIVGHDFYPRYHFSSSVNSVPRTKYKAKATVRFGEFDPENPKNLDAKKIIENINISMNG